MVQRWRTINGSDSNMQMHDDGQWCLFSEHKKELDELRTKIEQLTDELNSASRMCVDLIRNRIYVRENK